jgi:hypothetical protein
MYRNQKQKNGYLSFVPNDKRKRSAKRAFRQE